MRSWGNRLLIGGLVIALGFAVAWRLFVESEPPVEASIPFATSQPLDASEPVADPQPAAEAASNTGAAPEITIETTGQDETGLEAEIAVVHMAGAVERPGLVTGDTTWRIDDALRAAGGAVSAADLDRVNLAAPIADGQRIFVPYVDQAVPDLVLPDSSRAAGSGSFGATGGVGDVAAVININSADADELELLPGVGPSTAAAILAHREEFGAFGAVDALVTVPGIGPATLEAIRDYVSVGP